MSGFQCKQFYIKHDRCGMKVGTDAILLGSWAAIAGSQRVLDIGTGSGILSLMLAQRLADSGLKHYQLDAVELDSDAAKQAADNFANSPWPDHLCAHQADIHHWQGQAKYDLVISNPPYFNAGQQLDCQKRQQARLESSLSLSSLLCLAAEHCTETGKIALVLPLERLIDVNKWAEQQSWLVRRTLTIQPRAGKPAKRILVELSRGNSFSNHQVLTIYQSNNQYSDAFKALTKAFYLAF